MDILGNSQLLSGIFLVADYTRLCYSTAAPELVGTVAGTIDVCIGK